jgi:tetratricopeptide (TPR) repeat protein
VGKAQLAEKPGDPDARKQLVELVASLCKAQHVSEALALCAAAKDITRDAGYSSVLVLQQAVIASRDQKNHALAVHLCDEVAAAAGDANTIIVAKYLAGTFLLEQREYPGVVSRMESLVKDPATPLPYRLKASTLRATGLTRQGKPEEAVRMLPEVLAGLTEPEPAEAADCRQVLYQALLALQRYDEAVQQCRVLIARHPGHAGAGMAAQVLEQMNRKSDALPAESGK